MQTKIRQMRWKLLLIITIATIVALTVNIIIFYRYNINYAYLLSCYNLLFIILLPLIYFHKIPYELSANLTIFLEATLIYSLPIVNDESFNVISWVILFPIVPLSLKGHEIGIKISFLFFVTFISLFLLGYLHESYGYLHIIMVSLMHLVLTIVLFLILKTLSRREFEIQELNASLEMKVQKAKVEIREQEKIIFHQSRLAQMGEMISMIAHQWRQPLMSIAAVASSLKIKIGLETYEPKLFNDKLSDIIDYTNHLSATIDDFRSYFKPDKEKNSFYLNNTVANVLSLSSSLLESHNIEVVSDINPVAEVENFENELVQVIITIIKNGVDALLEMQVAQPKIYISLSQQAYDVVLKIEDNAGGIPQSIQNKIFEPYFSTKSKNGTGLGLYMAKSIVEQHCEGELDFYNGDKGACFSIRLPLKSD